MNDLLLLKPPDLDSLTFIQTNIPKEEAGYDPTDYKELHLPLLSLRKFKHLQLWSQFLMTAKHGFLTAADCLAQSQEDLAAYHHAMPRITSASTAPSIATTNDFATTLCHHPTQDDIHTEHGELSMSYAQYVLAQAHKNTQTYRQCKTAKHTEVPPSLWLPCLIYTCFLITFTANAAPNHPPLMNAMTEVLQVTSTIFLFHFFEKIGYTVDNKSSESPVATGWYSEYLTKDFYTHLSHNSYYPISYLDMHGEKVCYPTVEIIKTQTDRLDVDPNTYQVVMISLDDLIRDIYFKNPEEEGQCFRTTVVCKMNERQNGNKQITSLFNYESTTWNQTLAIYTDKMSQDFISIYEGLPDNQVIPTPMDNYPELDTALFQHPFFIGAF